MIQITIDEHSALGHFILSKAKQEGKTPSEVARDITQESFEQQVRELHQRFLVGEFSQGKLADMLGIPRIELIHLLEAMGLQVTNV